MRLWAKLTGRALALVTVTSAVVIGGALPGEAVTAPSPVNTGTAANINIPDPGAFLGNNHFFVFATGAGLKEYDAPEASGPWQADGQTLSGGLPSWAATDAGIWAPR